MDDPRKSVRYRGYRPPPLWWFRLKYFSGMAVFALFVILASFQIVHSILAGWVPAVFSKTDVIILWSDAPWLFAWRLLLWFAVGLLSFGGFWLLLARLRGLNGPSAETRL
jgi:hypothetical protein